MPKQRITLKLKRPNPLFEEWLTEWRDQAIENNWKTQRCYEMALESLRKYPIPLNSGRECKILQGFGTKLCQMLDDKLAQYNKENEKQLNQDIDKNRGSFNGTKNKKKQEYVPSYRSGAYAILITIYKKSLEASYEGYMSKQDIIKYAKPLCDKSFVKPDPGNFYTAWSSTRILIDKNLLKKRSSPAKYSLTAEGSLLAYKLYINNKHDKESEVNNAKCTSTASLDNQDKLLSVNSNSNRKKTKATSKKSKLSSNNSESSSEPSQSVTTFEEETFLFAPHTFNIILVVDKQETSGSSKNPSDDTILSELQNVDVLYEVRHLKVGDYTWICRHKIMDKELVLPYIIERKRMDDFACSIKDGRFHEQKFRLKQCGIKNLIYLIETHGDNNHTGLPFATLSQAAVNTLIHDKFNVKFTDSTRGTIQYLTTLTTMLKKLYSNNTLVSCRKENICDSLAMDDFVSLMVFQDFNKAASKSRNFKVREMFIRQLLQLSGMSVEKAIAVVDKYPTPKLLQLAYLNCTVNGEKLLSTIQYGNQNRKIGIVISKTIYQLFTNRAF